MMRTVSAKTKIAAMLTVALLGGTTTASAGPFSPDPAPRAAAPLVEQAQYYGYPYRPFGYYPYRPYGPYGYYPRRRFYNFYGPGAAKERYRTNRNFCNNQPEKC